MKTYTFLTKTYNEGQTEYFAIDPERIEEMRVSDTYDQYGQLISPGDAGDSLTLDTHKAVDVANAAYREWNEDEEEDKYSLGDYVSDYEDGDTFSAIRVADDLKENVDFTYNAQTCKGFNYCDGNNWASVIVEADDFEPDYEIVDDQQLVDDLNEAIEGMELVAEGSGQKSYHGGCYEIRLSQFGSAWESYYIVPLDKVEE